MYINCREAVHFFYLGIEILQNLVNNEKCKEFAAKNSKRETKIAYLFFLKFLIFSYSLKCDRTLCNKMSSLKHTDSADDANRR